MSDGTALAEKIQQEILELPPESLPDLEKFIEFLRFKIRTTEKAQKRPKRGRQAAPASDRCVAAYTIDGKEVIITEADEATVRAQLTRPHSRAAVRELALAYKLAEQDAQSSDEEQDRRFWETVEAIRAEAIAAGTAIDEPTELLADD